MSATEKAGNNRLMVKAELGGRHKYVTANGVNLSIVRRGEQYIVRGRLDRQQFGESLGNNEVDAYERLREIMVEIKDGRYTRPTEKKARSLKIASPMRLTLPDLCSRFVEDRRRARGEDTSTDYSSRLMHLLAFAEEASSKKKWPYAANMDRDFALSFRVFLQQRKTTTNGKAGGTQKPLSARHMHNILQTARTLVNWSTKSAVRLLPFDYVNPFDNEIVGGKPRKDPLRKQKLPLDFRIGIVPLLDCWQLTALGLNMILPLRPGESAGILITDIDFRVCTISLGTRFMGADFGKTHQEILCPFPRALIPLLMKCIGDRQEGPLLRQRSVWNLDKLVPGVADLEHLTLEINDAIITAGKRVQTDQDRKKVVRKHLRSLGAVSETALAKEFKSILRQMGMSARFYDLRHAVTSEMRRAGVKDLELRYMTSHTTNDILCEYDGLDPIGEAQKYFSHIEPLIASLISRAEELDCVDDRDPLAPIEIVYEDVGVS